MLHRTLALLMVVLFSATAVAADWKPAVTPLMTKWGKEVKPDNAWKDYPRPQLVRTDWLNLNGLWDYAITAKGAPQPERWDGQILVPFCPESALSGVGKTVTKDQNLWYRRAFEMPAGWKGKNVLLHFGAVDWEATVFVNGKEFVDAMSARVARANGGQSVRAEFGAPCSVADERSKVTCHLCGAASHEEPSSSR